MPNACPNSSWVRGLPCHPQMTEPEESLLSPPDWGLHASCYGPRLPRFHLGTQGDFQEKDSQDGAAPHKRPLAG